MVSKGAMRVSKGAGRASEGAGKASEGAWGAGFWGSLKSLQGSWEVFQKELVESLGAGTENDNEKKCSILLEVVWKRKIIDLLFTPFRNLKIARNFNWHPTGKWNLDQLVYAALPKKEPCVTKAFYLSLLHFVLSCCTTSTIGYL